MNTLGRIFGFGPGKLKTPESYIKFTDKDDTTRLRMVPDQSANAIAARWNQQMIYGKANMAPEFGMREVIEVKDADGNWQPVTGSRRGIPSTETQMAALSAYRETGVIGPAPSNADGETGAVAGGAAGNSGPPKLSKSQTEFDKMIERLREPGALSSLKPSGAINSTLEEAERFGQPTQQPVRIAAQSIPPAADQQRNTDMPYQPTQAAAPVASVTDLIQLGGRPKLQQSSPITSGISYAGNRTRQNF
jgi:hypothetical protein